MLEPTKTHPPRGMAPPLRGNPGSPLNHSIFIQSTSSLGPTQKTQSVPLQLFIFRPIWLDLYLVKQLID